MIQALYFWGLLMPDSIKKQVRRNLVAIVSLALAILSLSYNTWRNELTEHNRNVREAGFEMLVTLGEIHQIVFFLHYDQDHVRGNPRLGWARVLLVADLATMMPPSVSQAADALKVRWGDDWSRLGRDQAAADRISGAIDDIRDATLEALARLR